MEARMLWLLYSSHFRLSFFWNKALEEHHFVPENVIMDPLEFLQITCMTNSITSYLIMACWCNTQCLYTHSHTQQIFAKKYTWKNNKKKALYQFCLKPVKPIFFISFILKKTHTKHNHLAFNAGSIHEFYIGYVYRCQKSPPHKSHPINVQIDTDWYVTLNIKTGF